MSCFEGQDGATSEILNNVVRMLPGVPESEAESYVNQALRDFARAADLWTFKDYELPVCAGDQVVEIAADAGIEIKSVDKVLVQQAAQSGASGQGGQPSCGQTACEEQLCGCQVCGSDPYCWHELEEGDETLCQPAPAVCGSCGGGEWEYMTWESTGHQRGQVRFGRPWQCPVVLRFHLTLLPAEGSDTYPAHLIDDHRKTIEAGALAFGYMIPGQEWSNAEAALFWMRKWEIELAKAEAEREERKAKAQLRERLDMRPGRDAYCVSGYGRGRRMNEFYRQGGRDSGSGSYGAGGPVREQWAGESGSESGSESVQGCQPECC